MNKNYILLILEGEKTEPIIVNNLKKYFLNEKSNTIVKAVYGTVIYKLYKDFFPNNKLDEDLELFPLIQENIENLNGDELSNITRDQVSEIYLFFDYDSHATNADDDKLQNMFNLFNNETEHGKLFVSYPMVEAIKHLRDNIDFKNVIESSSREYKKIVSLNCNYNLNGLSNLEKKDWNFIIHEHSKKANYIVHNDFNLPNDIIEQNTIFNKQKEKYISVDKKVAVLASFPLFLLDYYGITIFKD